MKPVVIPLIREEEETCVMPVCGKRLGYSKNTPITDPRRKGHYIDAAGQLCDDCYEQLQR